MTFKPVNHRLFWFLLI